MEKQIVLVLWVSMAIFLVSTQDLSPPKECVFGTTEYNETLCKETCTTDTHKAEPYCANFTQAAAATTLQASSQPQTEIKNPVTVPPAVTSTPQDIKRIEEISTPYMDNVTTVFSSGVSLQLSVLCSVSCLILSIYI